MNNNIQSTSVQFTHVVANTPQEINDGMICMATNYLVLT